MTKQTQGDRTRLWAPSDSARRQTQLNAFWYKAKAGTELPLADYHALHAWSVEDKAGFWELVWDFCRIHGQPGEVVYQPAERFEDCRFFPDARLNFAKNLLWRRDEHTALVAIDEDGHTQRLSYRSLYQQAGQVAAGLTALGIKPGDRVAAYLPNGREAIVAALGCAWVGAIWSSCSPDFGVSGALDRFGQIEPRVLIAATQGQYNGKKLALAERVTQLQDKLQPELTLTVGGEPVANSEAFDLWCEAQGKAPDFAQLPFDHPLYILYSSGTTGLPKCIVHGAGGTLLQHAKEHRLHGDLRAEDVLFYYTTCGWMMWNWLVSGLQTGATLVLYDGNPAYPDMNRLLDLIDAEGITHFGTSAKFIQAIEKAGLKTADTHQLNNLRAIYSTGSPLLHESFDFVYQHIKADVQLSSISGGTDIISCFALGNPLLPVYRGELQCAGLGMDVAVLDDNGQPLTQGKGELVCQSPFPSKPIHFWNDPQGERYHNAYFARFDNRWAHGDYAELCPHEHFNGLIIHGRSDATLNPGGVRIGTAEIYRQVETLDAIKEALVVSQKWQDDVRLVLFVVLQPGVTLDDDLKHIIRTTIRQGATPRHVPKVILEVPELPHTLSGKVVEIAVRKIIHGEEVKNKHALANPDALKAFANRPELQE